MTQRKATRVIFKSEGEITFNDITIKGQIENLSLRGMFLKTSAKIDTNTNVDTKIYLSGTESDLSIKLKGIVTRLDKNGLAIQFDEMELDSFVHLKNIVSYNEGDADKIMREFHGYLREKNNPV